MQLPCKIKNILIKKVLNYPQGHVGRADDSDTNVNQVTPINLTGHFVDAKVLK